MNNIFQEYLNHTDEQAFKQDKQIFVYPNIPSRKIAGAMSYLPAQIRADEILAVVDDTVFGSSKEGITLTGDALYCKSSSKPTCYRLQDIQSIGCNEDFWSKNFYINGREAMTLSQPSLAGLQAFVQLVQGYLGYMEWDQSQRAETSSTNSDGDDEATVNFLIYFVDVVCAFALSNGQTLTSKMSEQISNLFTDMVENSRQMSILQTYIKRSNKLSPAQALNRFCDFFSDEEDNRFKSILIIFVCQTLEAQNQSLSEISTTALALGNRLGLSDELAEKTFFIYREEIRSTSSKPLNDQVIQACKVLEIDSKLISLEIVQHAYRSKIKDYHPDKYQSLPEPIKKMLHEKTLELNLAKDVLMEFCQ